MLQTIFVFMNDFIFDIIFLFFLWYDTIYILSFIHYYRYYCICCCVDSAIWRLWIPSAAATAAAASDPTTADPTASPPATATTVRWRLSELRGRCCRGCQSHGRRTGLRGLPCGWGSSRGESRCCGGGRGPAGAGTEAAGGGGGQRVDGA